MQEKPASDSDLAAKADKATQRPDHPEQGEQQNKTTLSKHIAGTISLLLLLALTLGLGLYYVINQQLAQKRSFNGQVFSIPKGHNIKRFANDLQKAGVIKEPYSLSLYARYNNLSGKLQAGEFKFTEGMTLLEVLDAVTTGKNQLKHHFKFVQGSTLKQLRRSIENTPNIQHSLGQLSDAEFLATFDINHRYTLAEGLFFPETYAYQAGESDIQILRRSYETMQSTLAELWEKRAKNLPLKTPYEALIMASIIEKETALASERPLISGVFMNRLNKGMRLQTDPTVIYGVGDAYAGDITRKHLKTDTPYNTYTRYGLPPTPICMPGRAAIEAALNPSKTDAIYFVAKGDGSRGHQFSKTLKEHNRGVQQYLRRRAKAN